MGLIFRRLLCLLAGLVFSLALTAADGDPQPAKKPAKQETLTATELRVRLQPIFSGVAIKEISRDEDLGLFRVLMDNLDEFFVTPDGKYLLSGDKHLIEQGSKPKITNLSSLERKKRQINFIKQIDSKDFIVFPAQDKRKAWVIVFTDIDCGYCRTFHRQIEAVTKLGIEVRYAAFPRSGIGTDSYRKAVEVWCAPNQLQAMTDAKNGKEVKAEQCPNPVEDHYAIGLKAGVRGTPTIFTSNDKVIPGYVPASRLAEILEI